jgi:hypothetical protein
VAEAAAVAHTEEARSAAEAVAEARTAAEVSAEGVDNRLQIETIDSSKKKKT